MIQKRLTLAAPSYLHCRKKTNKKYPRYNDVFERQDFPSLYATDIIAANHASFFLHHTKTTTHDKKKHTQLSAQLFTIQCTELAVAMLPHNCTNTKIASNNASWNRCKNNLSRSALETYRCNISPEVSGSSKTGHESTFPKGACGQATWHTVQHGCPTISRAVLFFLIHINNFQWSQIRLWKKKAFSSCCMHKQRQMLCYYKRTYLKWFEQ